MSEPKLSDAVDAANQAFFYGLALAPAERTRLARQIARHSGGPGAYADSFALSPEERARGVRVFTGERLTSASARHVLGEESTRALLLLGAREPEVKTALARATAGLSGAVLVSADASSSGGIGGVYCCGNCSVALWRHLGAGGLDHDERRLVAGLQYLNRHRKGEGEWRRFPFFYTVLTLTEIDLPHARRELKYAAPICERKLRRRSSDMYAVRRRDVLERALALI